MNTITQTESKAEKMLPQELIESVFPDVDLGDLTKRQVINMTLLTIACGYSVLGQASRICIELDLLEKVGFTATRLTKFGKEYMYQAFKIDDN